ncbi:endonuclease/exonuclease/phosphatase family protein [Jiulongibacter sediminis]|uniref:endonuclease/exonuclease/phosphatase family protein n=1 Tax=Jiulongibacter sediminis TaxID=1605367 RepID=UPI0026ECAF76|nr:endonuclease/exonuclease/phosphatase family protein [Jiulongibacter sediminis]
MRFLRDFITKFFFLLNFLAALYALLVFQISYAADIRHWLGGFLMLSIPFAFAINLFFLFTYAFSRSWKFVVSLVVLIIGYPLMERTLKFSLRSETELGDQRLSVMSYNVMYLNHADRSDDGKALAARISNDLDTLRADIKCFQEIMNSPQEPLFDTFDRLKKVNKHFTYMHSEIDPKSEFGAVGLATFSKYPIVAKKEISWKINNNGVLITDIKFKEDTVRVFNLQFKSMGIRVQKAITADEIKRKQEARNILSQLKSGFEDRALQVDQVEELIKESPYPVILAGDFNELPYGYAYGRVRKELANAFEEAGFGFGFTYHKLPSFIRIDNIFFDSDKFEVLNFKTFNVLKGSDHYPIKASLKIRN